MIAHTTGAADIPLLLAIIGLVTAMVVLLSVGFREPR